MKITRQAVYCAFVIASSVVLLLNFITNVYAFHDTTTWNGIKIEKSELKHDILYQLNFLFNIDDVENIELFTTDIIINDTKVNIYRITGSKICRLSVCPHLIEVVMAGNNSILNVLWCEDLVRVKEELRHDRTKTLFQVVKFKNSGKIILVSIFGTGMINTIVID